MFKKIGIFALLLSFALLVSACSGPTGDGAAPATDADTESIDLVFAWWGNPLRNQMTYDVLLLFEAEHPHITVEQHTVGWGDYWSMLATMAAGGNLPDVIQMADTHLGQYVANNLLIDLEPMINSGAINMSDVDPLLITLGRVGDGIFDISIGVNANSMGYNKTLLDSMDITLEYHMTMDDFIDVARHIHNISGYRTLFPSFLLEFMIRARGYVMYTEEGLGGQPEYYQEFFEILAMGIEEGWIIPPEALAGRTGMEESPIFFGSEPGFRTWNAFPWSSQLTVYQSQAPEGMELALTTIPTRNPRLSNLVRSGQSLSITTHSNHPNEAAMIIDFFTNSIEANEILLAERGLPISSVVSQAIYPLVDESTQRADYFVNQVMTPYSSPPNPARPEESPMVENHLTLLTEMVSHGTMTPADATRDLFDFANSVFGN